MGKAFVIIGVVLIAVGLVWIAGERLGLGRLPGDIVIEREGFTFYIPLMSSLVVSVVASLVLWFFMR